MVQWILIYLQVIFLRGLMLRLKINDLETYIRKYQTLKKIKYYAVIATLIEAALSIASQSVMKDKGKIIENDIGL